MKFFKKALFPQAAVSLRRLVLSFYLCYGNDMNTLLPMGEPTLKGLAKALLLLFAAMLKNSEH